MGQATLFDAETDLNPYVVAYEAATDGAPFVGWQYVVWNSQQWAAWAEETGADSARPRTPDERDAFGAWLADRWGVAS